MLILDHSSLLDFFIYSKGLFIVCWNAIAVEHKLSVLFDLLNSVIVHVSCLFQHNYRGTRLPAWILAWIAKCLSICSLCWSFSQVIFASEVCSAFLIKYQFSRQTLVWLNLRLTPAKNRMTSKDSLWLVTAYYSSSLCGSFLWVKLEILTRTLISNNWLRRLITLK